MFYKSVSHTNHVLQVPISHYSCSTSPEFTVIVFYKSWFHTIRVLTVLISHCSCSVGPHFTLIEFYKSWLHINRFCKCWVHIDRLLQVLISHCSCSESPEFTLIVFFKFWFHKSGLISHQSCSRRAEFTLIVLYTFWIGIRLCFTSPDLTLIVFYQFWVQYWSRSPLVTGSEFNIDHVLPRFRVYEATGQCWTSFRPETNTKTKQAEFLFVHKLKTKRPGTGTTDALFLPSYSHADVHNSKWLGSHLFFYTLSFSFVLLPMFCSLLHCTCS